MGEMPFGGGAGRLHWKERVKTHTGAEPFQVEFPTRGAATRRATRCA